MQFVAPWYQVPSKSYVRYTLLPELYSETLGEVRMSIDMHNPKRINFTSDVWTSNEIMVAYIITFLKH